jgi:hypothetical protein
MKKILKNKNYFFCSTIVAYLLLILSVPLNVVNEQQSVKIWCLQKDSIIFTRIENHTDVPIYIPTDYIIQYTDISDTAYFEGVYNKKYDFKNYYYYHSAFSKPIYSFEKIEGLKYDSSKNVQHSLVDLQFNPPEMTTVSPGSTLKIENYITSYKNKHFVSIRIYKTTYPFDPKKNYSEYHSHREFVKYENSSSYLICVKIYTGE